MEETGICQFCSQKIGTPLNRTGLSQEGKIVVVDGHIVARVDESGEFRYNKHHNMEEVQDLMENG